MLHRLKLNRYLDLGENVMVKNMIRSITIALILLICCSGVQGAGNNLLRLEAPCGWSQHIVVPQGATAYLVVLAAKEGIGELKELSPNGNIHNYNYFFRRYDHLPFYADAPWKARLILHHRWHQKQSRRNRCNRKLCIDHLPAAKCCDPCWSTRLG